MEQTRFHPKMAFFHNHSVHLSSHLGGIHEYASSQLLDFIDLTKNCSFLNWKLPCAQISFMVGRKRCLFCILCSQVSLYFVIQYTGIYFAHEYPKVLGMKKMATWFSLRLSFRL